MKIDAQELVYDAMEAWGTPEGEILAKQALNLDPRNPDALLLIAAVTESLDETKALVEEALASAEERLGKNFEKRFAGIFWLEGDTRPYMRALAALADVANASGDRKTAIATYERMLKLNPNDNQGVRYALLGLLLAERKLPKIQKLLEAYNDERTAWFAWGRVLYHFTLKDYPTASRLLKKARAGNPFVEEYLSGRRPFPEVLPDYYTIGEEDEAVLAVLDLGEAWSRRQDARFWLIAQLGDDPAFKRHVVKMIKSR